MREWGMEIGECRMRSEELHLRRNGMGHQSMRVGGERRERSGPVGALVGNT